MLVCAIHIRISMRVLHYVTYHKIPNDLDDCATYTRSVSGSGETCSDGDDTGEPREEHYLMATYGPLV